MGVLKRLTRAWRIRSCACLSLILLLILSICVLLYLLVSSVRQARAAPLEANARHYVILVDASRSVAGSPGNQTLAREVAMTTLAHLRASAGEGDTVRLVLFGTRAMTALTTTRLHDAALEANMQAVLANVQSLGGTAIAETLAGVLDGDPLATDVILITDGVPDTSATQTSAGRISYATRIRELATRYAQRQVRLSVLLVGQAWRTEWRPVWEQATAATGGVLAEILTLDDISPAMQALVISTPVPATRPPRLTPTITPTSRPAASATAAPISTPAPSPTVVVVAEPETAPGAFPWPAVLAGMAILGVIGRLVVNRVLRPRPAPQAEPPFSDQGILQVCDPQTGDVQQIELQEMGLGEVWKMGSSPDCQIRLGREPGEEEYAALVLTPDGPMIESRSRPLWFDDLPVKHHLLFDGDDVYLGPFVIGYQNFFRRRKLRGEDDPEEEDVTNDSDSDSDSDSGGQSPLRRACPE